MSSAVALLCPKRAYSKALDAMRESCNADIGLEGSEEAWERVTLRFPSGTMVLTSLVRQVPGDKFSKLVLSMHNFFRTVKTDAECNKNYVLARIENVEMMIGVVAEPELSDTDARLDCLWRLAEQIDAVIFNGDSMLNLAGERIISRSGEHDVLL